MGCRCNSLSSKEICKPEFSDKFSWMDIQEKAKCLVCDRPAVIRGLCKSHYEIFRRTKKSSKDPEEFEARAIAKKLISPEDRRMAKNPFEDLLNEMAAEEQESFEVTNRKKKA